MRLRDLIHQSGEILRQAGIDSYRLDAEILFCAQSGLERSAIYTHPEMEIDEVLIQAYQEKIRRREKREPVAYILGEKEFYGLNFFVNPHVLIPRPDTETLVEAAIEEVRRRQNNDFVSVLDLCTGSGCIGLSIADTTDRCDLILSDYSNEALSVAAKNAAYHGIAAQIVHSDLFDAFSPEEEKFDLIVSNPPYIAEDEIERLEPEICVWEPHLALSGGHDGYSIYKRIVNQASHFLNPGGMLLLEAGDSQASAILEMLKEAGYGSLRTFKDLQGIDRAVAGFLSDKLDCDTI